MTLSDIAIVFGITTSLVTAGGTAVKFYGDHTYVLVSESLQGQLFALEREIKRLELEDDRDAKDDAYLDFLRLQAEQLRRKIE